MSVPPFKPETPVANGRTRCRFPEPGPLPSFPTETSKTSRPHLFSEGPGGRTSRGPWWTEGPDSPTLSVPDRPCSLGVSPAARPDRPVRSLHRPGPAGGRGPLGTGTGVRTQEKKRGSGEKEDRSTGSGRNRKGSVGTRSPSRSPGRGSGLGASRVGVVPSLSFLPSLPWQDKETDF